MGVTPTAAATRRMVTASAPPVSSRSRAAAAIRDAVVRAITYTVYIKIVYGVYGEVKAAISETFAKPFVRSSALAYRQLKFEMPSVR